MEANRRRKINDGKAFDHLFPPPSGQDKSVKQRADVEDTLNLIRATVPQTLWQTKAIARKLRGRTLDETCANIWHFVYDHIQYKRDKEGVEQIRSPRRTWWERETGVDCDCYTEFISSILMNLKIPHKARITKYPKRPPEVPRWQHIYPVVPRNGRLDEDLASRDDYIVLDCVKDDYDDEQEYLERKDYDMRLDYLDGFEEEETAMMEIMPEYELPELADVNDLASVYDDEQLEMGNIFKKVGQGIKKAAQKVGQAAKKVGDTVGKGIRVVNRFVNPATILLRNGFLLAMKMNMKNVAGRLRYAYLTDAQAKERGINLDALKKLKTVMHRAETIYWQAGGKKENLKKAILEGKGNKDKRVPLSGLYGIDDEYMDIEEYNVIHADTDELIGLGDPATGTALAAATGAVAALSAALKQIKGLFNKGGSEEQAFQSESEDPVSTIKQVVKQVTSAITRPTPAKPPVTPMPSPAPRPAPSPRPSPPSTSPVRTSPPPVPPPPVRSYTMPPLPPPAKTPVTQETPYETVTSVETQDDPADPVFTESALPDTTASRRSPAPADDKPALPSPVLANEDKGALQKAMAWIKANPGKTILISGVAITGGYLVAKALSGNKQPQNRSGELSGVPKNRNRNRNRNRNKNKRRNTRRNNIQHIKLL